MLGTERKDEQRNVSEETRREYEPPAIEAESSFETLVLACGGTPIDCPGDPPS
jgi:hypothetical protein